MAGCYACQKRLCHSWNVFIAHSPHAEAGILFDVNDGYVLSSLTPNWVFCFCDRCWQKYTLALSSMLHAKQVNALQAQNKRLREQLNVAQGRSVSLQQALTSGEQDCIALQNWLTSSPTESFTFESQWDEETEEENDLSSSSDVNEVLEADKNMLVSADVSEEMVIASPAPLEAECEQTEIDLPSWDKLSDMLT